MKFLGSIKEAKDIINKGYLDESLVGVARMYVGPGDMPEDCNIQIDPTSESIDFSSLATKEYVEQEIATFDFIKVVEDLPEVGLENRFYLVPKNDSQTQDLFDEYMWVNKGTEEEPQWGWEWVTTKQIEVDLTPYATIKYTDTVAVNTLKNVYPVGSIYLTMNATNPAELFGFGTWEKLPDRFLLGASDTYKVGSTGGEATHTLSIEEMPAHDHGYNTVGWKDKTGRIKSHVEVQEYLDYNQNRTTTKVGGSQPHNNMPPYIAVYMWQRTA